MSTHKIAETSTVTGTGNVTLLGAWSQSNTFNTGNRTFFSFYGLNHYFPYMIQDTVGNWEKGRGYLSASNVLVRAYVLDNSLGTQALINFPSGEKLVMVPTEADVFGTDQLNNNWLWTTSYHAIGYHGATALAVNRVYFCPFVVRRPIKVTKTAFNVTAAGAASTIARIGIYNSTKQPDSASAGWDYQFPLMLDIGSVAVDTTGTKSFSTNYNLGRGVYLFAIVSNGTPSVTSKNSQYSTGDLLPTTGLGDPTLGSWIDSAAAVTALPSTSGIPGNGSNASMPAFFLQGSFL